MSRRHTLRPLRLNWSTPLSAPILLNDDNREVLRTYVDILADHHGYQVIATPDPLDALAICQEQPIGLIVSDVMKPQRQMDGVAFFLSVRSDPTTWHIPFLFATATPRDALEELVGPLDGYLNKPFHAAELVYQVRRLLHAQDYEW